MNQIIKTFLSFFAGEAGTGRLFFFGGIFIFIAALNAWAASWIDGYELWVYACGFIGLAAMFGGGTQIALSCKNN